MGFGYYCSDMTSTVEHKLDNKYGNKMKIGVKYKGPNDWVSGPKYSSSHSIWELKPYYLVPLTLRVVKDHQVFFTITLVVF